jgi:glutaminyl-tRNA synthetase
MEDAPKDFFRLSPGGREVRLKGAYIVRATGCEKDADGNITTVFCEYDEQTRSGMPESNRKVKSTINWVEISSSVEAEVRIYDRLFSVENPAADERDFRELLNPDSLKVLKGCRVEAALANARPLENYQFLKNGYFCVDPDSRCEHLIFNRTVSLKDAWSKKERA